MVSPTGADETKESASGASLARRADAKVGGKIMSGYPETMAENLDPEMKFRKETIRALRRFRRARPWSGSIDSRKRKFRDLHCELNAIYGTAFFLNMVNVRVNNPSGQGSFDPRSGSITVYGKLSVITYLHEFAHGLFGPSERQACRWSINLFQRVFPEKFNRLTGDGHRAVIRRT